MFVNRMFLSHVFVLTFQGCYVSVSRVTCDHVDEDIQPRRAICEVVADDAINASHVEIGTSLRFTIFVPANLTCRLF